LQNQLHVITADNLFRISGQDVERVCELIGRASSDLTHGPRRLSHRLPHACCSFVV